MPQSNKRKTQAFKSSDGRQAVLNGYQSILEQLPVPFEKIMLPTCCGNTFVLQSGEKSKSKILLLHGSGSNSAMWFEDIVHYSKEYCVYAVDIPGEPGFSNEVQYSLHSQDYSDWLNDVFIALDIDKAILIGLSLGGFLAIKFCIERPDKVEQLVLISPSGIGRQKKSFMLSSLFYMLQGEKGVKKLYTLINGKKPLSNDTLDYLMTLQRNFNYRKESIPVFSDEQIHSLKIPVMLLVGERDVMLDSNDSANRLKNLYPSSFIKLLPEEGHSIMSTYRHIDSFIRKQ